MADSEELNLIEGTVEAVIYQNQENGYTVLKLDCGEQGGITVVGCMPGAAPGEGLSVRGSWMRHASYGEQFKAETVDRRMPAGEKAVFDYLASGAVRGIGAATAKRMVEEFGSETLNILEENPELLTKIHGVTRKRALAMGENFRSQMGMRRLLEFLAANGLPLQLAMPLYRRYGDRTLEVLRSNPYLLVDELYGVDFAVMDEIALSMGVAGDSRRRVEAAGTEVQLTAKEFDLLQLFVTNRGKVFSREMLMESIWKYEFLGDLRTVDVHIRRLREKIEKNPAQPMYIFTKWGVGYYFTDKD